MVQHGSWQRVQQGGQPRPVGGTEPDPIAVQLPLENHDLVAQRKNLGVLGPIAHR
ncbi:hypothetical protein ACL02O_31715 [Micromonospora sp. MS34]|uniref:hypothetical protein n=1 Tax=Micromonospora sp. MS34 TaxID=3385971 RepID=UPI00399F403A